MGHKIMMDAEGELPLRKVYRSELIKFGEL